jgi:hypothetical protein
METIDSDAIQRQLRSINFLSGCIEPLYDTFRHRLLKQNLLSLPTGCIAEISTFLDDHTGHSDATPLCQRFPYAQCVCLDDDNGITQER